MPVVCVALVSRDIIKSSYFGCFLYPAAPSDAAAGSSPLSLEQALVLNVSLWIFAACGVLLCLGGHTQGSNRPRELGSEEAAGMGLEGSGITAER